MSRFSDFVRMIHRSQVSMDDVIRRAYDAERSLEESCKECKELRAAFIAVRACDCSGWCSACLATSDSALKAGE